MFVIASAHRHDLDFAKFILQLSDRLQASFLRHKDVAENEVGGSLAESLDTFCSVTSYTDFVALAFQNFPNERPNLDVVVYYHDRSHASLRLGLPFLFVQHN
jgi:hypothetical protein